MVCVSVSDCLLLVNMRLPSILSQLWDCHQCTLQRRTAGPQHVSSALLLFPFLLIAATAPCTGAVLCKPLSVLVTQSGDEFLHTAAPNPQSLRAASNSFLGNSFLMEINLFGQGCSLVAVWIIFKSELTATAINCRVFGQEPHLCSTSQLLQGLHAGGLEKLRGRPRGSWLQK